MAIIIEKIGRIDDFSKPVVQVTDENGKKTSYDYVGIAVDGLRPVRIKNDCGYIDAKTGKQVCNLIYSWTDNFCNGIAAIKFGKEFWIVDKNLDPVIPEGFHDAAEVMGKTRVRKDNKLGSIEIGDDGDYFVNYYGKAVGTYNSTF